ncbi:AadA family aminoglycoside 3''-O-nucleotidyltransferase [Hydrogenophaga sp. 2FB]|uniref:AadA family aminoglycoside 3''-O-nucleotidyltransferase n=1 Tax=Hydrogenophaga sp. 2FB TaxID=2502187 RepID=UPI0010F9F5DA|nr:AadA family aminoglycoside 3''-O-nucleotidyltransferase [Hydrogenophaga sp. 2FB]
MPGPGTRPPADIAAQLARARTVLERHLSGAMQSLHLFGSAVAGGLKPHSDIDLLATVDAPLAEPLRRALMTDLLSVSAWPGSSATLRALEVTVLVQGDVLPWRYLPRRELQFGEWLREDLLRGVVEPAVPDHDLAILLTEVRQHSVCLMGVPADQLFAPVPRADFHRALLDTIAQWNGAQDWRGDERNVVLALARIWFTVVTGGIAPKDVAAAWALWRLPSDLQPVLVGARDAYLGLAPDDLADRAAEVAAWVGYVKAEISRVPTLFQRG